jgi:ATP-dependent helicase/nuclease subunit A
MLPRPQAGHGSAEIPVWAGRKDDDPPVLAAARAEGLAKAEAEHRRLLYVAMTRAKDRLVVCGHDTGRTRPDGAWYDLVRDGLLLAADVEEVSQGSEPPGLRLRSGPGVVAPPEAAAPSVAEPPPPAWLAEDAPFEAAPGKPLSPSAIVAEDEAAPVFASSPGAEMARARGVLLHRLLKTLPEVPAERRAEAAANIAAGGIAQFGLDACRMLAQSALEIVGDPAFVEVFSPEGRGEVPIVGTLRDGRPVSGRIDRLAVTAREVLVVDYKTDRIPPPPGAPIPAAYAGQLGAYAELLGEIWPNRPVRAAILWTAAPRLDQVALPAPPLP